MEFRLGAGDLSAVRFGISPGHELVHAVRVVLRPQAVPLQWGWFRHLGVRRPDPALRLLAVISGADGYMPDFLTSSPSGDMTPQEELARLRAVPEERLRADLAKMLDRSTGVRHEEIRALRVDPASARSRIADAWEAVWEQLLAPVWPQMLRLLRADIAVRVRRIGDRGLGEMAATLHSSVTWSEGTVRVRTRLHEEVVDCGGTGLVLVPSVMHSGPGCSVLTEPPAQPTIFYPAHGVTESRYRQDAAPHEALAALLGHARAVLVRELQQPLSTTECAERAGLAISTASHHLHVLREAGLVDSRREGRSVLHARTPLGEALANGR